MANYDTLKASIQAVIKQNGNNEITGTLLQSSLVSMITSLGAGYQFMGEAKPSTSPGTPDQKVVYFATEPGIYANFGGEIVGKGELCYFYYDTSWHRVHLSINDAVSFNGYFIGSGQTYNSREMVNLVPGHTYRMTFPQTSWDLSGWTTQEGWKLLVRSAHGNTTSIKVGAGYNDPIQQEYIFTIEDDFTSLHIGGRAANGTNVFYNLQDITSFVRGTIQDTPNYGSSDVVSGDGIYKATAIKNNIDEYGKLSQGSINQWGYDSSQVDCIGDENYYIVRPGAIIDFTTSLRVRITKYDSAKNGISHTSYSNTRHYVIEDGVSYVRFSYATAGSVPISPSDISAGEITVIIYNDASGLVNSLLKERETEVTGILSQNRNKEIDIYNVLSHSDIKLAFFSDIHGKRRSLERIVEFINHYNALSSIDALLNGGDTVSNVISDGLAWYNPIIGTCDIDVLNCVGNHDAWINSVTLASRVDVYNLIMPTVVSQAVHGGTIIQPANAARDGLNYYYKDYGSVRVVVIDTMFYDDAQNAWLIATLTNAKSAGKSVLTLIHGPFPQSLCKWKYDNIGQFNEQERNPFFSYHSTLYPQNYGDILVPTQALLAVKNFVDTGGSFICWLAGHLHYDYLFELTDVSTYGRQSMFATATANGERGEGDCRRIDGDPSEDCLNIIGINLSLNHFKLLRIGIDTDSMLRQKSYLCYDYKRQILINAE